MCISSNTYIIGEDVHWAPLAHDMDQNLTKWANISLSWTAPCWWVTYIYKHMRIGFAKSEELLLKLCTLLMK